MENGKLPAFASKPYPEFADDFKNNFSAWQGVNPTGLTKREYFAAMAMQGFCACPDLKIENKHLAEAAVDVADELLKALEK